MTASIINKVILLKPQKRPSLHSNLGLIVLMIILLGLTMGEVYAAQIKVAVDRNPVGLEESFQLIFTAAETPDDDPDFSPLEQDFDIISQSTSSSATWLNGKASKSIQWTLNVMAKQSGSLIVPPIKFGKDVSQTLVVMVTQGTASKNLNAEDDIIVEVAAAPKNPFIQSQIIYTVRIYSRVEIVRASLNEPQLADAVIEKLGDDSNYTTQVNGIDYSVTERKYAVFPQKSGLLTIQPLILTAEVLSNSRPSFNGFFSSQLTRTQKVVSKSIDLEVKPVPASFTGTNWLSAENLELTEEWSGDIQQMKVGEPLTRTLTLQAKGATVGQLPELNTAQADNRIKIYPDQPVLQEQKQAEGLIALRQEKIALIPTKAGSYTLPSIEIPWFNTKNQAMETVKIPAVTITAIAASGPETTAQAPAAAPVKPLKYSSAIIRQIEKTNLWLWVSLFLAAGWLLTLIFFVRKGPLRKPVETVREKDGESTVFIKDLKKACASNDAAAAKNALIGWGKLEYKATSLGAIASCCDARLRNEILELNRTLYSKEMREWQGKKLFQAFSEHKARKQLAGREDRSLEPLYRL
jgi:hypothetical protein